MNLEETDVIWLEQCAECSLDELAERSRLSVNVLHELIDFGVLEPRDSSAVHLKFDPAVITAAQTAARLQSDFELGAEGIALALILMRRIRELETEVQRIRATGLQG